MINPVLADIGRPVIFTPPHDPSGRSYRNGQIKSFNDEWVFVLYTTGDTAAATKREHLTWEK